MGAQRRKAEDVVIRVPRVLPNHVPPPNLSGRPKEDSEPSQSDAIDSDLGSGSQRVDKGKRKAEEPLGVQQGRPGARAAGDGEFDQDERPPMRVELGSLPDDQRQALHLRACASAAEWNSLLRWARAQRGPQWDAGTGIWQVDKGSEEYYEFCENPTQMEDKRKAKGPEQNNNEEEEDAGPRGRASNRNDGDSSPILGPGHGHPGRNRGRRGL